jgi:ribosomal protein S18 acetylase RimI-like enzyme
VASLIVRDVDGLVSLGLVIREEHPQSDRGGWPAAPALHAPRLMGLFRRRGATYVSPVSLRPVMPKPSAHLRPATGHDVGFLTDVVVVVTRAQGRMPRDFDDRAFRDRFVARTLQQVEGLVPDSTTYVIEIDGERAGRLRVVRGPQALDIAGIQLLPAHQGRGIGTYLIEQLLVEAHDAGKPARIRAEPDNLRALALYRRLGFTEVGTEEGEVVLESAPRPFGDGTRPEAAIARWT